MNMYYFIRSTGEVGRSYDRGEPDDIKRKVIGNYFTESEGAVDFVITLLFAVLRGRSSKLSQRQPNPLYPLVAMLIRILDTIIRDGSKGPAILKH